MSKRQLPLTEVTSPACEVTPLARQPLTPQAAGELAVVFKALSDPVRLRLLSVIASHTGQEACVCDVSQPTISHHLRVLREAGLLSSQRRGSWVYYRVEPAALAQLSALLDIALPEAVTR
ncbi:ArsR/SmtB family transcription factor [Nocardia niigatensis]